MTVYTIHMTTSIGKWAYWIETNAETMQSRPLQAEDDKSSVLQSLSILNETKIILLLTWGKYWRMRFSMGRIGFINAGCEVSNCILTQNQKFVPGYDFDAFLVHMPTARKGPWILPNRTSNQIFVLFSTEPPGILFNELCIGEIYS